MTILEDLFYGNIDPNEKRFDKKSEYAKFSKIVIDSEELLTEFINKLPNAEKEQQAFSRMINAQSELSDFIAYERFVEGFRLGAGVMLEVFVMPQQSVVRDICVRQMHVKASSATLLRLLQASASDRHYCLAQRVI